DQAVRGRVYGPADRARVAVVGAPGPDVVDQGVVRVDDQAVSGLARDVTADAEEGVLHRDRVAAVAGTRSLGPDREQRAGVGRARVEQQAVDPDPVHVRHLHGVHAV